MNCLGCQLANKKVPVHVVFEDDFVCCILDHMPYNDGHVLILPKKHVQYFDELDEETAQSLMKATQIISQTVRNLYKPDGITRCQNGGLFDELSHFHEHVIPRYEGQNFSDFYSETDEEIFAVEESALEKTRKTIIKAINEFN